MTAESTPAWKQALGRAFIPTLHKAGLMEITDRFAQAWVQWDDRVHDRSQARSFLGQAKDEELLELLAAESSKDRKYERDIVTTELQNRLSGRAASHPKGADDVMAAAWGAYEAAAHGQKAIHTAEAILKASGEDDLGRAVSTAAYVSLDTSKVALEAARAHASELRAALAHSRVAERLLEEAAQAASDVVARAAAGAKRVEELGHREEAEAARKAADLIRIAAEIAARKLHESRRAATADLDGDPERLRIDEADAAHEATELIREAADVAVRKLYDDRRT